MVMKVCGILLMVIVAAPYELIFEVTNSLAPLVSVTTVMTEETPMITPSRVRIERSLFAHSDCRASRKASTSCMVPVSFAEPGGRTKPMPASRPRANHILSGFSIV